MVSLMNLAQAHVPFFREVLEAFEEDPFVATHLLFPLVAAQGSFLTKAEAEEALQVARLVDLPAYP